MYYGSKSKTKPKQKEPQRSPRIIGLGLIKLDFYMNLTDEQIKQYNIDFSKINSPKDLAFIAEDQTLLDLIQISSSDTLSNILLYLNKASIQKSFVELITLSPFKVHPEEEHMKKIFTHVTEHNYLFSNEMSVTSVPNKISFAFKNGKKLLKYFDIVTDYDPYMDDVLIEDKNKLDDDKAVFNNLYNSIDASINKNRNEIKEIENYNKNIEKNYYGNMRNNNDLDILNRDDMYNEMNNQIEISKQENSKRKLFDDDDVNYKINEVHEEDVNSNQNFSSIQKTQSKKSKNNFEERQENTSNNNLNNDHEEGLSRKAENFEEMNHSQKSQNMSKMSKKSQSKKEKNSNLDEENMEKNNEDENKNNYENNDMEDMENASNANKSKILNTNSINKNLEESNIHKKEDDEDDFAVEDLEEIKDENFESLNLKTQSKKKENILTSHRDIDELDNKDNISKKSMSYKNQEENEKQQTNKIISDNNNVYNVSQNSKNSNKNKQSNNLNNNHLNEDLKKNIRPLYEGLDISRQAKPTYGAKLINIPAACEIEEYDFLFIDLEEFINFHTHGFHLNELAEFMKKISTNDKKPRIVLNYPNILINLNVVNLELLETIMNIMSYTDIFLFEKKECLAFFNMLNQMNYEKDLSDKQLIDYFFKEIPHKKSSVNKLGLFLDDLQRFNIAEQKKDKIVNNLSYEINLYPKINHFNQKVVDEYKKIMAINNSYFKSIFFGGYFSNYIFNEDHYISYFTGAESTKRILEIFKNKIDFPTNPEFYLVKLQKSKIIKDLEQEKLKQKEEKFVLDCVNKTNSSIKYYNPLFDDNLNAFFASSVIRKQLKDKGFINTNGFVLYDSSYKSLLGGPPKPKKRLDTSERERHLLLAIKQNKELLSTDLENFSKSLKGQSPTNRKLPLPNIELNSSNLYISSKIKNLKVSKKKLKPLYTKNNNTKSMEKSLEKNKTSEGKSPKANKEISSSNNFNTSNKNNQNSNNYNFNNEDLENSDKNNEDEAYNYKEKSKISSRNESLLDGNSENELLKSKNKSKTYTVSMGNNNRYTENSKNNFDISRSKKDLSNSKQMSDSKNNYENEEDKEENKDYLEQSKGKNKTSNDFEMEENIEGEQSNNNELNDEENKAENENEEIDENEKNDENENNNYDEMGNARDVEANENNEEEKKEGIENEENNNLEKFENKIEQQEEENMENEQVENQEGEVNNDKEEDKIEAEAEN